MIFEMIYNLLLARMNLGSNVFSNDFKFYAMAYGLPFEMEMRITICGLKPKVFSSCHSDFY